LLGILEGKGANSAKSSLGTNLSISLATLLRDIRVIRRLVH